MSHDDPFAGKTVHADWAYYLDTAGTYTPTLTGATTDPNLGADGEATGAWHRSGHLITGWARFLFSGSGLDAGSGTYRISLPFDADTSTLASAGLLGAASMLGSGFIRDDDTAANSGLVVTFLTGAAEVRMAKSSSNGAVTHASPFAWAGGDRISITFAYLADPDGLPS